jgi:hypothetical protein
MSEHAVASSLRVPPLNAAHEYAVQCISMLVGDALNSAMQDVSRVCDPGDAGLGQVPEAMKAARM